MDWIAVIFAYIVINGIGLFIYSGRANDILTVVFRKSFYDRSKIDYKYYQRFGLVFAIVMDAFVSILIFT